MKTKTIEARQIGWMVLKYEDTYKNWLTFGDTIWESERQAEDNYNYKTGYGKPTFDILKTKGLARCVPVYVEVSDEA